jgi:hypothetical protein
MAPQHLLALWSATRRSDGRCGLLSWRQQQRQFFWDRHDLSGQQHDLSGFDKAHKSAALTQSKSAHSKALYLNLKK